MRLIGRILAERFFVRCKESSEARIGYTHEPVSAGYGEKTPALQRLVIGGRPKSEMASTDARIAIRPFQFRIASPINKQNRTRLNARCSRYGRFGFGLMAGKFTLSAAFAERCYAASAHTEMAMRFVMSSSRLHLLEEAALLSILSS